MRSPYYMYVSVVCIPYPILNQLTNFHETRYERHAVGDYHSSVVFSFRQSVISVCRMHQLVRWKPLKLLEIYTAFVAFSLCRTQNNNMAVVRQFSLAFGLIGNNK
jgi:hypothetical protein